MTTWGVTRWIGVLALVLAGCSGGDDAAPTTTTAPSSSTTTTTTAPERPASTTTTAFDPASVEGQVEAAYLKSWDVYADAVYNLQLNEPALTSVYAKAALTTVENEVRGRIEDGRAAHVLVDHRYVVHADTAMTANVIDQYVNHQVLIDPDTKQPTEPDPNQAKVVNFRLELIDGTWRVTVIQDVSA